MTPSTLLLVEDDAELCDVLSRGLGEEGFDVSTAATGAAALRRVERDAPDALVVDIGLPDADGRDVCQALRARGIRTPVLFLTARDSATDRVSGFSAGGDDYLTKPFAFAELVARLRLLLRRGGLETVIETGGLRLDPIAFSVTWRGVGFDVTPTEFRLLATLADKRRHTVKRRELVRSAWPDGAIVHDNTLDVYIARLRRKLRALPEPPTIATVHGVGYRLT